MTKKEKKIMKQIQGAVKAMEGTKLMAKDITRMYDKMVEEGVEPPLYIWLGDKTYLIEKDGTLTDATINPLLKEEE